MAATKQRSSASYNQMVVGDLAYSREYQERERAFRRAGNRSTLSFEHTKETVKKQEKVVVEEIVRVAQGLPVVAMAGFAIVAVMAIMTLVSYVQLTDISDEVVSLRSELSSLETENISLTTDYEQMFDLATVKDVATANGMTKPSSSQIFYIDLSGGDTAVVHEASGKTSTFTRLASIVDDRINTMVEYFR